MRPSNGETCGVSNVTKVSQSGLLVGIQAPVSCTLSGTAFHRWSIPEEGQTIPNYLGILSLAWSYILSTRLIELQPQDGARVEYTNAVDIGHTAVEDTTTINIDIGKVSRHAARWWTSLFAPVQGWMAILTERENEIFLTPWSVTLGGEHRVKVIWHDEECLVQDSAADIPPTSGEAFSMLVDFCLLHDLGTQFLASFAAALTFPTHNHYKMDIELPVPNNVKDWTGPPPAQQDAAEEWVILNEQLPYYIALSCNYAVVSSSLCGSFWEPGIPCNLVSAWLHPVLKEIPRKHEIVDSPGRYAEILALMCGFRRPPIFALWIGAAISGLVPKTLNLVGTGTPPLDPNGFPWTGCPQSFMDLAGSGPYFRQHSSGESMIERVDAWRLLYLPVVEPDGLHYESFPFSPWQPVGRTKENNCVFRVRAHKSCPRHCLEYEYWTWQLPNKSTIHDSGLQSSNFQSYPESEPPLPKTVDPAIPLSDQVASREASIEVFRWVLANHEGKPASEPIYHDDWIADCDYSDGSLQESAAGDACSIPDTSNQRQLSIVGWMDGVEISQDVS